MNGRRRRRLHYEDLQVLFLWYNVLLQFDHDHAEDLTRGQEEFSCKVQSTTKDKQAKAVNKF